VGFLKLRRYYDRRKKYSTTYREEYLKELEKKGAPVDLIDNAEVEMILSKEEEESYYEDCLQRVLNNPREVLDNLEKLPEFRVSWKNYRKLKGGRHSH
jgi:hypothetical protein